MKRPRLGRMPRWQRWFTVLTFIICSVSGIAFLLGHEYHLHRSVLGTHHVLVLHGVASALALIAFGTVMPFHIKAGLQAKQNVVSGVFQLALLLGLVVSALLLYYGPAEWREGSKLTHWVMGLIFFCIFVIHIVRRVFKAANTGLINN